MKLAIETKFPPPELPSASLDSGHPTTFFHHIVKAATVTRKEIWYGLRVSKTVADAWLNGNKPDPLTRARDVVFLVRHKHRTDLIPAILAFIGGADDCTVLTAEQTEALRILAKAVKE